MPSVAACTPLTERQEREWYEERASDDNGNVNFVVAVDARKSQSDSEVHQNSMRSEDGEYEDVRYYSVLESEWDREN